MIHDPQNLTPQERRRSLAAVITCIGTVGLAFGLTFPLLSLAMNRMGTPETVMGLNAAMFALATLTVSPFLPKLAARIGTIPFLLAALLIAVLTLLTFKAFEIIWLWFPLRFLTGAALAALFVVSEIWINQLADHERRGRILALYSMALAGGFALGPLLLVVTGTRGWPPFLGGAAILALAAAPPLLARRLAPPILADAPSRFRAFFSKAPTALMATIVYAAIEGGVFNFLPIYGLHGGFSESAAPRLLVALAIGSLACQIPIGWLADKWDKRRLIVLLAGLCGAGALSLPLVMPHIWILFPLLFLMGGAIEGLYTVALTEVGSRFRGADLSIVSAAMAAAFGAVELVGPIFVGAVMQIWTPHGFALAVALLAFYFTLFAGYRTWRTRF